MQLAPTVAANGEQRGAAVTNVLFPKLDQKPIDKIRAGVYQVDNGVAGLKS